METKQFEKAIGYAFQSPELLKQALTHPSIEGKNNQRLEFLGDAVLEYHITLTLYQEYPEDDEGGLTHLRSRLVCQATLAEIAKQIGLPEVLLLNKSQLLDGGRENPAILADGVEAVIGAVSLDGGIEAAGRVITRLWKDINPQKVLEKDYKSSLQETVQAQGKSAPSYQLIEEKGPDHQKVFTSIAVVDGNTVGKGSGRSKRAAEQEAARQALQHLHRKNRKAQG
ncbi:MAG: ribonuclease III [Clostridiales bacterium]|nr:ribonuclease III [Clostridiales bacterium]